MAKGGSAEKTVREIRRKTRRRFSAEEKIRIVLEGIRGEESIATLCRREGIVTNPRMFATICPCPPAWLHGGYQARTIQTACPVPLT